MYVYVDALRWKFAEGVKRDGYIVDVIRCSSSLEIAEAGSNRNPYSGWWHLLLPLLVCSSSPYKDIQPPSTASIQKYYVLMYL